MESADDVTVHSSDKSAAHVRSRQNQVSTVLLGGVPIVCLRMDDVDRLCLAQISNTLLKDFSYNEIHNRRVALGITCVQCTPVQLEILRRAGAMPISSRRCGMITKREAERLVKSFLEDAAPPKLPENFAFEVFHKCGWGCQGRFMPSRYNSSRAKCIKCTYCNLFFSPNKFIFHSHRTPVANYTHPDAANFNSWRRHLQLFNSDNSEALEHAWEDVKAMFNGGSRKRSAPTHHNQSPSARHVEKRKRLDSDIAVPSMATVPYPYPMFSLPSTKAALSGFFPRPSHPAFPILPIPTDHVSHPNHASMVADMFKNNYHSVFPAGYGALWGRGPTSPSSHFNFASSYGSLCPEKTDIREIVKSKRYLAGSMASGSPSYSAFQPVSVKVKESPLGTSELNVTSSDSEDEYSDGRSEAFNDSPKDIDETEEIESPVDRQEVKDERAGEKSSPSATIKLNEDAKQVKHADLPQAKELHIELERLAQIKKRMENCYKEIKGTFCADTDDQTTESSVENGQLTSIKEQIREAESMLVDFTRKMTELRQDFNEDGLAPETRVSTALYS